MVDFGKLAKKAKGIVDKHGDKIASGVDKATDFADKRTKGKHRDKLDKLNALAEKLDKTEKPEAAEKPPARAKPPVPKPPAPDGEPG
jgi:hypothetical protein